MFRTVCNIYASDQSSDDVAQIYDGPDDIPSDFLQLRLNGAAGTASYRKDRCAILDHHQ
jgi:hypothetical protein